MFSGGLASALVFSLSPSPSISSLSADNDVSLQGFQGLARWYSDPQQKYCLDTN